MFLVVPQDFQDQALPRQEAETEQAHSSVDQDENWQQDQVSLFVLCIIRMMCTESLHSAHVDKTYVTRFEAQYLSYLHPTAS